MMLSFRASVSTKIIKTHTLSVSVSSTTKKKKSKKNDEKLRLEGGA